MTSTEIELHRNGQVAVPVVAEMDSWITVCSDVIKVANVICDTPFVPDGLRGSGPAVAAAILAGRELSLGPMTSLANIHVIKGKPALSAVLMRALVQAQGHQWQDGDVTDTRAVVRGRRKGEAEWTEVTFTADQAKRAGIELGKYPQDKLYARATSRLARRKFADVIAGMPYSAEDLEDGEVPEGTVTETAASNGHAEPAKPAEKPAPRTAQRRTRTAPARPAPAPAPAAAEKPADPALPPLPGEDEASGETGPEPSHLDPRAGLIVKHFERIGYDDRDVRLALTAQLAGLDSLNSTRDLPPDKAKAVLDTLARCKDGERLDTILGELDAQARQDAAEASQEVPGE